MRLDAKKIAAENGWSLVQMTNGMWQARIKSRVAYSHTAEGALITVLNREQGYVLHAGRPVTPRSLALRLASASSIVTPDRDAPPPRILESGDEPLPEGTPKGSTKEEREESE